MDLEHVTFLNMNANKDFSCTVLKMLKTHNGIYKSTSGGDVLFDDEKYWFLVPSYDKSHRKL